MFDLYLLRLNILYIVQTCWYYTVMQYSDGPRAQKTEFIEYGET